MREAEYVNPLDANFKKYIKQQKTAMTQQQQESIRYIRYRLCSFNRKFLKLSFFWIMSTSKRLQ